VRWQIVREDDVPGRQCRHKHLLHVGPERGPVHRAIQHHGRDHAGEPQTCHEGRGFPVAFRDGGPQPVAPRRASAQAGHVGAGARLVDEDQPGRVEIELALEPRLALLQNGGPVLLGGMRGLLLTLKPQRSRKVQIVPTLAVMPRSASRRFCISRRVRSGVASIRPSRKARCGSSFERRGWPCRRAARSPSGAPD